MVFKMPAQTEAILGEDRVTGVRFADGEEIAADLVVMAVGIRPNVELARKAGLYCERGIVVSDTMRPEITARAPPITSDPPEHKPAKQLLLPPFTPDAMKKLEPRVRAICNELIDEFIADGKCDAAARYTKHIPVRAIAHMGSAASVLRRRAV